MLSCLKKPVLWPTLMANPWQVDESAVFQSAGCVTSTAVMRDEGGRSRGFGFVNYASAADASRALSELDGHTDAGCVWQASRIHCVQPDHQRQAFVAIPL